MLRRRLAVLLFLSVFAAQLFSLSLLYLAGLGGYAEYAGGILAGALAAASGTIWHKESQSRTPTGRASP